MLLKGRDSVLFSPKSPPCLVCNRRPINHRTEYCNSQARGDKESGAEAQGDHMALLKVTGGYELAQACLGQGDC